MMVTQANITNAIKEKGISNKVVCLHSSLKSFGYVEGGADVIIQAFSHEGCTLVVPTFSNYYYQIERNGDAHTKPQDIEEIYSPLGNKANKDMGAIPHEILRKENRIRGNNPLSSFTAIGPKAKEIIANQELQNVYGPYKYIFENEDAVIILMGVDLTKATPIHFSEELAGRKLLRGWSKTSNGDIQEVHMGSCSNGFNNFCSSISHIEETVKVGKSLWRIYPFKKFVSTIADTIKQDPMITHCDNNNCCVCNHVIKGEAIL